MEKHFDRSNSLPEPPTRPCVARLLVLVILFVLGSFLPSAKARAECLGCPPVAWHVEAVSAEATVEGYLSISAFLAKKNIDVAAERKNNVVFEEYVKRAKIWRRALAVSHVFEGTCLERQWQEPLKGDRPAREMEVKREESCKFTLLPRHLLLVGPGEPLAPDDVLWLRDKSGIEGPVSLRWPIFEVSETGALELARGPRLAVEYNPSDGLGTTIYCFAFESGPELHELEKLCQSEHESETWPTVEGDGWLILIDHPGT